MSAGMRIAKFAGIIVLCLSGLTSASAERAQKKPKKPELPPLPSGPTGPIQQVPLDTIAPVLPQVSYENGQLTIVAPNSTLGDVLRAVRKQTGAEIEVPEAKERVVTHLGPGPARDVIAELLNGSRFNYVLLGSPEDASVLTRVVLVPKTGPETAANQPGGQQQAAMRHPVEMAQQAEETMPDANDAEAADENNVDDTPDQPAAEEQPVAQPDQSGQPPIKTPQQLLQEMQQRQLQMQQQLQQQQPGQAPAPGPGPVQQQPPQQQ
jgi:hypothetical protein